MSIGFDLSCWYLNARRIGELVGGDIHVQPEEIKEQRGHLASLYQLNRLKDSVVDWCKINKPKPLELEIINNTLEIGSIFTFHSPFYFKGLSKISKQIDAGSRPSMALGYTNLKNLSHFKKLKFDFSHDHLTSNSSWVELAGQKKKLILAVVTDIKNSIIECKPYVIANLVSESSELISYEQMSLANYLECHPRSVSEFAKIKDLKFNRSIASLKVLKNISESDVKKAFAEIIGEPTIPKDWGGEQSDLFSSRLTLNEKPISAAFLFKGPASFKPMTLAQLGKNGDQINRLFMEPADLLIIQHCHEITPPVRMMMRAFANQSGNLRQYCIIDGHDTLSILRAYDKCGFTQDGK